MGMWHGLASESAVIDSDVERIYSIMVFHFFSDLAYKLPKVRLLFTAQFKNAGDMPFWDDQQMSRRYGEAVIERHEQI